MDQERPTPTRRSTDAWRLKPIALAFIILTVLFVGTLIGFAWVVHDVQTNAGQLSTLAKSNSELLKEMQKSRIQSCQQTYEGVRQVFKPLFPTPPLTPRQLDDLSTFNTTIDKLKRGCVEQTKPKE